jgi:hypothetical protein
VISPFKGHGSDATSELGGYFVLVNAKLIHDESGSFTISNDFRRIGIVKDPVLSSDGSSPATELDYQQSVRLTFSTISGTTFAADEVVTGSTSNSTGVVLDWTPGTAVLRLVETTGAFVPGETVVGANCSGVLLTYAGTAVSATSTTIVLPSGASSANDFYTGQTIKILTGTGSRQIRKIIGYVGVSRTATVNTAWSPNPDNTSTFKIANIVPPDLVPYSGQILYLENRRPIARASNQTEDVKIVVEF